MGVLCHGWVPSFWSFDGGNMAMMILHISEIGCFTGFSQPFRTCVGKVHTKIVHFPVLFLTYLFLLSLIVPQMSETLQVM